MYIDTFARQGYESLEDFQDAGKVDGRAQEVDLID